MKLTLHAPVATYTIHSYGIGYVVINQQRYTRSIVVMPQQLITDWPPRDVASLTVKHCAELVRYPIDVLLLGTGEQPQFPPRAILLPLVEHGIGVDIMNLGAACRTYNLLITENRQVAVALLL